MATGQIGAEPCVHVWDAMSKETLSVIQGFHTKGVCAVGFSCNGKLLVTVGIDAGHSIAVWKWAEGLPSVFFLYLRVQAFLESGYLIPE